MTIETLLPNGRLLIVPDQFSDMQAALREHGREPGYWQMSRETARDCQVQDATLCSLPIVYSEFMPPMFIALRAEGDEPLMGELEGRGEWGTNPFEADLRPRLLVKAMPKP